MRYLHNYISVKNSVCIYIYVDSKGWKPGNMRYSHDHHDHLCMVGGLTILKNISQLGRIIPYIVKIKMFETTNQVYMYIIYMIIYD